MFTAENMRNTVAARFGIERARTILGRSAFNESDSEEKTRDDFAELLGDAEARAALLDYPDAPAP